LHDEDTLEFDDVCLAFLTVFHLPLDEDVCREQAIEYLKEMGARWGPPHSEDFETAEEFLLPSEIIKQYFRVELDGFRVFFVSGERHVSSDADVFLTVYPRIKVGILMFNFKLSACDTDDIIFMEQSQEGRFRVGIEARSSFLEEPEMSLKEVAEKYVKRILDCFSAKGEDFKPLLARCIEIRAISCIKIDDPNELLENYVNQIYGMLTADEG
jgi:hypothetical protein